MGFFLADESFLLGSAVLLSYDSLSLTIFLQVS